MGTARPSPCGRIFLFALKSFGGEDTIAGKSRKGEKAEESDMARTAYCKHCGKEVEAGEVCPECGTRLGKNAAHAAWCVERTPVKDWMYWNSVMRLLLPGALAILILVLLLAGISGGAEALEKMLSSAFPAVLGILLLTTVAVIFAVLLLRGKELSDFVIDNRGVHETRYLPNPTPLKLMLRMKAPGAAKGDAPVVKLSEHHIAWKDVARIQLWPEKCTVLFYAPAWWLRIPVICTPFTWEDTMEYIREKLGKKKKVRLPQSLRAAAEPAAPRRRARTAPAYTEPEVRQMRMDEAEPARIQEARQTRTDGAEDSETPEAWQTRMDETALSETLPAEETIGEVPEVQKPDA